MKWVDSATLDHYAAIQRMIISSGKSSAIEFGGSGSNMSYPNFEPLLITDLRIPESVDSPMVQVDFNLPILLPNQYEIAICIDALYYAKDPLKSLNYFIDTVKIGGDIVLSLPWFYPHHDLQLPQWRMHPLIMTDILNKHFKEVDIISIGKLYNLPSIYLNRFLRKYFNLWPEAYSFRNMVMESSKKKRRLQPFSTVNRHSPLWFVIHAKGKIT
jgi:hypothetical protein